MLPSAWPEHRVRLRNFLHAQKMRTPRLRDRGLASRENHARDVFLSPVCDSLVFVLSLDNLRKESKLVSSEGKR